MARKRFVTSEISTDRKIAKLAEKNPVAAALWPWFITAFDDWGRMNADPFEPLDPGPMNLGTGRREVRGVMYR